MLSYYGGQSGLTLYAHGDPHATADAESGEPLIGAAAF